MKKLCVLCVLLGVLAVSLPATGVERGTAREAEVLVHKAVAHLKAAGPDKAFADFTNGAGGFTNTDLYIVGCGIYQQ
jgi:cytochrome c